MKVSLLLLALAGISNSGINAKPPSKIVGGYREDITDAPFMVMIIRRVNSTYRTECGGSIISNRHILTAAHCLEDPRYRRKTIVPDSLIILAGKTLHRTFVRGYKIDQIYIHPYYKPTMSHIVIKGSDIAVIKLKEEIPFDSTHRSIGLATEKPSSPFTGFAYGWGSPSPYSSHNVDSLRQITLQAHNSTDCDKLYKHRLFADDVLCANNVYQNGGICDGDSGGPLVVEYNKGAGIAGIASRGINCTIGYFIDVFHHKLWIEDAVKGTAKGMVFPARGAAGIKPVHVYNELRKLI